jgi:hypothetical protein
MSDKPGHMTHSYFYHTFMTTHSVDALLCVLLEFRIGGILEGMQLERVDISPCVQMVGGFIIAFRRSDYTHFLIDTSDALTHWPDARSDRNDSNDTRWSLEQDVDVICYRLQEQLAHLIVSRPPKDKKRVVAGSSHERA